jgi:hypothetical protein
MLSVTFTYFYDKCYYGKCNFVMLRYAECHYAKCRGANLGPIARNILHCSLRLQALS